MEDVIYNPIRKKPILQLYDIFKRLSNFLSLQFQVNSFKLSQNKLEENA